MENKDKNRVKDDLQTPPSEPNLEMANAIIHIIGIIFGVSAMPILSALSLKTGNISDITAVTIYAFSFLMTFTFSTLYHIVSDVDLKRNLRKFDHISIYILIAGTYTPFLLIYIFDSFGISLLVIQWSLVLLGTVFKLFYTGKFKLLSTMIYIAMGCLLFVGGKKFFVALPTPVMIWIMVGGALYIFGCVFYLNKKIYYHHAIWHLFVLLAAICHYVAVGVAIYNW